MSMVVLGLAHVRAVKMPAQPCKTQPLLDEQADQDVLQIKSEMEGQKNSEEALTLRESCCRHTTATIFFLWPPVSECICNLH